MNSNYVLPYLRMRHRLEKSNITNIVELIVAQKTNESVQVLHHSTIKYFQSSNCPTRNLLYTFKHCVSGYSETRNDTLKS